MGMLRQGPASQATAIHGVFLCTLDRLKTLSHVRDEHRGSPALQGHRPYNRLDLRQKDHGKKKKAHSGDRTLAGEVRSRLLYR